MHSRHSHKTRNQEFLKNSKILLSPFLISTNQSLIFRLKICYWLVFDWSAPQDGFSDLKEYWHYYPEETQHACLGISNIQYPISKPVPDVLRSCLVMLPLC